MRSRSELSEQAPSVLAPPREEPSQRRHGYALAGQTSLLYPSLIRLAGCGLVEACWQQEPAARPGARAARTGRDVVAPVVSWAG